MTTKNTKVTKMEFEALSNRVIGAAIEVHKTLGPGLLESVYEQAMAYEVAALGLSVQSQLSLPVAYKSVTLDCGFRLDLLVEQQLIVEIKSVEALLPVHDAQLKTGLLINFNVPLLKQGIKRLVL